ncbi:protein mono-ADP-ribosyltransferase PARP14-like, partial [Ruditapes philippinarum]|uniref:protein mono-ADP-ribosyltransferase PARP14-like n=1 Tax=Ruditapes philippinarum TaxID=129788 RepID=UPI00295B2784
TECLVVLTSKDLNLDKGNLSKKVLKEGGPDLAKEIRSKFKGITLGNGTFISTSPGNLKHKGVKRLIFGHLPKWYNHTVRLKVLQQFVEGCLIEADEQDCKSIAFPALGTGNLEYPPRDVATAMLDGIESYTEESMIAKLKTVYITTTDDAMFQILGMEQKNRGDQNTRGDGDIANDAEILSSNDNRINYTVVMERHLQTNPSGKFVKVQFMLRLEAGSMNCPTQWLLLIGCGTTQKDLEKA